MNKAEWFFSDEDKARILTAIKSAENETSGEIRLFIEDSCNINTLDRAAEIFKTLDMHKTALRNGVLFYLAVGSKRFAIIGDAGINSKVPSNFWDDIKISTLEAFAQEKFAEGLIAGVSKAGLALKQYFPRSSDDINELPDDIVFGKD